MAPSHGAIETAYEQHGPALLAYLRRQAGMAAEDLLQETFVQAMRGGAKFDEAVSPRAWLFGIARHLVLTARRRLRVYAPLPDECAAEASPAEDSRIEWMRGAIARLPEGQREALELRLRHELSYEEIAEVLGIPVGTVRSRLHHALQRLREEMSAKGRER